MPERKSHMAAKFKGRANKGCDSSDECSKKGICREKIAQMKEYVKMSSLLFSVLGDAGLKCFSLCKFASTGICPVDKEVIQTSCYLV